MKPKRIGTVARSRLECVLAAIAVAVIVMAYAPRLADRQRVSLARPSAEQLEYWLSVDDPALARLRERLAENEKPNDALAAVLRWQSDVCRWYAEELDRDRPLIAQVSYQPPVDSTGPATESGPASVAYWRAASHDRERRLQTHADTRHQAAQRRATVELGEVVAGGYPPTSLASAAVIGLICYLAFALWIRWFPQRTLFRGSAEYTGAEEDPINDAKATLCLRVPSDWVRLRQPSGVRLRQTLTWMLVGWAMLLIGG